MNNTIKLLPILLGLSNYPAIAIAADASKNYSIPASPLANALTAFGDQANVKLVFDPTITKTMNSSGIHGNYSINDGLSKLLSGSGLNYRLAGNNVFVVEKSAPKTPKSQPLEAPGTTKLPEVDVYGKAENNATDPYNEDYALPDATAGTKTDTPIIETPLNVQVISKQVLKDQQAITLGDALRNVSGVTVSSTLNNGSPADNNGQGATNITLRGFISQTFFRDGFRLQQGAGARQLANVESIEVLKGPAAVLYGLVEPGGLVNVVTKQPQATPYYAFNQQFGSFDNYRSTADATGPVAGRDDLLYRLNFSYQTTGGIQDFTGTNDVFVAPVLTWLISPKTQATLEFEYNRQHVGLNSPFNPFINGQLLDIPLSRNYGEYAPAITETFFGSVKWSHQFNDDWSLKHRFSVNQQSYANTIYPFAAAVGTADSLNSFFNVTGDFTGFQVLRQSFLNTVTQNNTYSTNLDVIGHFETAGIKHTLLLGGDYYRLNNQNSRLTPNNNTTLTLIDPFSPVHPGVASVGDGFGDSSTTFNEQIDQYGLYLQDQVKLPFDFHFTGGFRYQYIQQNSITTDPGNPGPTIVAQQQDAITPRVGILWHPQDWISLYTNYSESFGANTGLVFLSEGSFAPVAPTSAKQIEGGIKTEFFGGRLRATLAYFDLTKTNVAVDDPLHRTECGGPCSLAIGEVNSQGPELDIQGEILPGWNAIATWANVDVRITQTNADNDAIGDPSGSLSTINPGDRLFNVPRNTANFWTTYEFQSGDLKGLKLGGGTTVQEGTIGAPGLDGPIKVPGFATLNLFTSYSYTIGKAKITAQLNVDNVLDKRYFTNINGFINDPSAPVFGAFAAFGAPRTFLGSISVQY